MKSSSCDEWVWSGSCEQFLHCGLRKFRHSKSSVYRWYTQLDRCQFVYDTWDNGSRLGRVMVECTLSVTHCLRLNLQLHTIDLVRTCRISSFCTVAWQLARFQLTRRIARSLGDSWASCLKKVLVFGNTVYVYFVLFFGLIKVISMSVCDPPCTKSWRCHCLKLADYTDWKLGLQYS